MTSACPSTIGVFSVPERVASADESSRQTAVHEQQRFDLLKVHVARLNLDRSDRRLSLEGEGAIHRQRLIAARQPQVVDLDTVLTVLDRHFRSGHRPPLDPLGPQGQLRQMDLLMIRVKDQDSSRVQLPLLFLDVRRELETVSLVGGFRGDGIQLQPAGLEQGRGRIRLHVRFLEFQSPARSPNTGC